MSFIFPNWTNRLLVVVGAGAVAGAGYVGAVVFAAMHPTTQHVGYQPTQPVPFSHKLHAGELKMDCRYCHNTVDKAAHAAIPPSATCNNCHSGVSAATQQTPYVAVHPESKKLAKIRESNATGDPVEWIRVHNLPDYVYFNHSAHVNSGVSCVSCHGRVDRMEKVQKVKTLSMAFCLDCHRNPEPHLRPLDKVTDLSWVPDEEPEVVGARIREEQDLHPKVNCSTCHR